MVAKNVVTVDKQQYQLYTNGGLLTDEEVHMQINGVGVPGTVPANATSAPAATGPNIWLIVSLLMVFAALSLAWVIYVFRRHRSNQPAFATASSQSPRSARKGAEKLMAESTAGKVGGKSKSVAESVKEPSVEERKEQLLQVLLRQEKSYKAGKLSKQEFQARQAKTKARLRALMDEQETTAGA